MVKKEAWISVLLVVVLLVLGVFLTQKTTWFESSYNYSEFPEDEFFIPDDIPNVNAECYSSGDCVKIRTSCCQCSSGGEEICTTKKNAKEYETKLEKCNPAETICAQVFNCKINSCSCINGKCAEI